MTITPHPQHPAAEPQFDDTDRAFAAAAMTERDKLAGPLTGDYVDFADGVTRRISYIWDRKSAQTSDDGSFHLAGSGRMSFSGALYPGVPAEMLTATTQYRPAPAWILHHDRWTAHWGVHFDVPVQVWKCSLPAPK